MRPLREASYVMGLLLELDDLAGRFPAGAAGDDASPEVKPGEDPPAGAVATQVTDGGLRRLEPDGKVDPGDQLRQVTEPECDLRGVALVR